MGLLGSISRGDAKIFFGELKSAIAWGQLGVRNMLGNFSVVLVGRRIGFYK